MDTEPIGSVAMVSDGQAPDGWQFCRGQLLLISQYGALFSVIGTTYGGDGVKNFALPVLDPSLNVIRCV